jgi:hypothetical protein
MKRDAGEAMNRPGRGGASPPAHPGPASDAPAAPESAGDSPLSPGAGSEIPQPGGPASDATADTGPASDAPADTPPAGSAPADTPPAGSAPADTPPASDAPADTPPASDASASDASASPRPAPAPAGAAGRLRAAASRPAARHLALLAIYLAAGVALTWPRAAFVVEGRLPAVHDVGSYVWALWWVARQVTHLGNPWFTRYMAAPVGIQLGFGTTMPLAGLVMTPVTLAFGPSASFGLLTVAAPGLLCYVMYRAARLWLAGPGAIAAGAFFGLSSMLTFQDWYHLNIALGTLFLPMTLEATIRLRRRPGVRQGLILGLVLGLSVLVNQESAVMAVLLAAVGLVPWLLRAPLARLRSVAIGAVVAAVVASPQLIAMAQQEISGGAKVAPSVLANTYILYGAGLPALFAPSPRIAELGLHGLASVYSYRVPTEGVVAFGVVLSALAVLGLAVAWRRRGAWLLALLWLGGAALALGPTLTIMNSTYVPLAEKWNGVRVSRLLPYTWLIRIPGLAALREADRLALIGLVGAAMLAGAAVDWLYRNARPLIAVVLILGAVEAGWVGHHGTMPTALPALDGPIAADHSNSIVVDVPFGLRGGIPLYARPFSPEALVLATADGHPRAVSYSSWVPAATKAGIRNHPFYTGLVAAQFGRPRSTQEIAAARRDARAMNIGWVLVWVSKPVRVAYLKEVGFRFDYRADGVSVYRADWK